MRRHTLRVLTLALLILIGFSACDEFSLREQYFIDSGELLVLQPAVAAVRADGTLQFAASGGAPGYTYRVPSDSLGSIDPGTGVYTAPSQGGEFTVEAVDKSGDVVLGLVYVVDRQPLRITPTSVSVQTDGTFTFTASGGTEPYTFSSADTGVADFLDSSVGELTAASTGGNTVITVEDADGITTSATVYVYAGDELDLIPSENPIVQNQSVDLQVVGETGSVSISVTGTADLGYSDLSDGNGYVIGGSPNRFVATDTVGIIVIEITDDMGAPGSPGDDMTDTLQVTVLPATPTALVADGITGNPKSIELRWEYATEGVVQFELQRRDASASANPWQGIATPGPSTRSYLDDVGLAPNTPYEYRIRVKAEDSVAYWSKWSDTVYSVSNP